LQKVTLAYIARQNATPSVTKAGIQGHDQTIKLGKEVKESPMEVLSKVATQLESAAHGKKNHSRFFLSSAKIFARWDKGLCEWCDEHYLPMHECK